jgi:hypothetical protein
MISAIIDAVVAMTKSIIARPIAVSKTCEPNT